MTDVEGACLPADVDRQTDVNIEHTLTPLRGSARLRDEQIAALKDPGGNRRSEIFSSEEQTVLRSTDLLTSRPGNVEQGDIDTLTQHFSAAQIVELVIVIATANWTNRVNDGAQTPPG